MHRDDDWFERLYERHHRAIAAYCARRVAHGDAPDVAARVFAVAWRRRDDVPDGERTLPWLYGVARREVSHQWRGARRARRLLERTGGLRVVAPPTPEVVAAATEEQRLVREAVRELGDLDREVLLLTAWEGLTHAATAEVLGCSRAAVDKRVARAKVRLAERYADVAGRAAAIEPPDRPTGSPVRAPNGGERRDA